jgi:hypothetical protein
MPSVDLKSELLESVRVGFLEVDQENLRSHVLATPLYGRADPWSRLISHLLALRLVAAVDALRYISASPRRWPLAATTWELSAPQTPSGRSLSLETTKASHIRPARFSRRFQLAENMPEGRYSLALALEARAA